MKKAVIILGHGSRHADADSTVLRVAADVRNSGSFDIVAHAFLKHTKPGPEEALEYCVRQGAGTIVIVPFFLQPGAHVVKDVPALVQKAQCRFPDVQVRVTEPAGSHPLMAKIVAELAEISILPNRGAL